MGKKLSRSQQADATALPTEGEHETEPTSDSSEESSWAELGSTRVVGGGATPTAPPGRPSGPEGSVVGDFQLIKKLGEGAMGAVFKARQVSDGRLVALKILFPHVASNPKLVERLYREGRVMGQLDHPNIVQAYAVGECTGSHYVAMEYIDGQSMQKWLGRVGRLSVEDAVHVILICARALTYAHKTGVVHRDIKPDNILVTKKGVVKVADLGMVKFDDDDMALTQTGHAVGTPWYMPLEQARNAKEIDGRSDIYALGCTLYCLLVGHPPFIGRTLVEVIQAKEQGTFPPVRQFNQEVPERLDLVIAKMTQKKVKDRYQSCEELIRDLEALQLASAEVTFVHSKAAAAPKPPPAPVSESSGDRTMESGEIEPNTWYVQFKNPDGRMAARKYTTAQLEKMIAEGTINASAKVSKGAEGNYRSLATYKEFQGTALAKITKKGADNKSAHIRGLYKQITDKEEQKDKTAAAREARKQTMQAAAHWGTIALVMGLSLGGILLLGGFLWLITSMFNN